MASLAKSTVLGLSLLAGVAFAAHAQSGSVAALPSGAAAAPPAATAPVGPSPAWVGPNPGQGYYGGIVQSPAAVAASPAWNGPKPGAGWYAQEQKTQEIKPSSAYPGPRPN